MAEQQQLQANQVKQAFILHGWAVDPKNEAKWSDFRQALEQQGLNSTFIPLPGLTSPLKQVWQLADYVSYVRQELKAAPVEAAQTVLIGHSFGGQIAARLVAEDPNIANSLVLIAPAGLRPNDLISKIKRLVFFLAAKLGKQFTRSQRWRQLLYTLAREKDYLQASPTLRQTMAKVINTDISTELTQIALPTLVVWGENDPVTPLKLAERFVRLLPAAQLEVIAQARHGPQFSHHKIVAKKVAAFVGDQW